MTPAPAAVTVPVDVRFRLCREDDLTPLEWFGELTPHREIIRDTYRRQLAGEQVMVVADAGGFPVAQLWIDLLARAAEAAAVLWAVRVLAWLRGRGLGAAMLAWAEDAVRARGFTSAVLGVERTNPAARRFYERHGYRWFGAVRERYAFTPPGAARVDAIADLWLLRKRLT